MNAPFLELYLTSTLSGSIGGLIRVRVPNILELEPAVVSFGVGYHVFELSLGGEEARLEVRLSCYCHGALTFRGLNVQLNRIPFVQRFGCSDIEW